MTLTKIVFFLGVAGASRLILAWPCGFAILAMHEVMLGHLIIDQGAPYAPCLLLPMIGS